MYQANLLLFKAFSSLLVVRERLSGPAGRGHRDAESDRGDIPGWVMIAIMSAAVVVVLIPFVGPVIAKAFSNAVDSVTNTNSGNGGQ